MKYLDKAGPSVARAIRIFGGGSRHVALVASGLLILAGCAHKPPVTIVPVATSCVTGDLPSEPPKVSGELTGDAGRDAGIIAGSALRLRAWGRTLYQMLEACRSQ